MLAFGWQISFKDCAGLYSETAPREFFLVFESTVFEERLNSAKGSLYHLTIWFAGRHHSDWRWRLCERRQSGRFREQDESYQYWRGGQPGAPGRKNSSRRRCPWFKMKAIHFQELFWEEQPVEAVTFYSFLLRGIRAMNKVCMIT